VRSCSVVSLSFSRVDSTDDKSGGSPATDKSKEAASVKNLEKGGPRLWVSRKRVTPTTRGSFELDSGDAESYRKFCPGCKQSVRSWTWQ